MLTHFLVLVLNMIFEVQDNQTVKVELYNSNKSDGKMCHVCTRFIAKEHVHILRIESI